MSENRILLVDASVFITLADIGSAELLRQSTGKAVMPQRVVEEISSEPAASELQKALGSHIFSDTLTQSHAVFDEWERQLEEAAIHLGRPSDPKQWGGDVPLLAAALKYDDPVVLSDDKPLRQACKTLSVPVSGSIGVLVRGVERGDVDAERAKSKLEAMDEVGARLSASLYREAERLIEDAATE